MEDVNNSYHYTPCHGPQGGWLVLRLVDGKCLPFPETDDTRVINCETEHEAYSCAAYHVITFGGSVTRGGRS